MRISTAIALIGLVAFARPASAADPAAGGELARRWCSACHLVSPDQARVPTVAPTFASIGQRPGFNAQTLARSMLAPHPQMPDRGLSREQAEDIAAYIATLR